MVDQSAAGDFVVCPFTLAIDTREQASWSFHGITSDAKDGRAPLVIRTERKTLKTGDYSIVGHEDDIAIERKEKGDLFNCLGNDRARFEKQVQRLAELKYGYVIVEADILSLLAGHPRSGLNPKVTLRTIASWQMRYRSVHWFLCPTRGSAEEACFRILDCFWRKYRS